jgi:5,10-methylenetetrahydromethanopterin reductase
MRYAHDDMQPQNFCERERSRIRWNMKVGTVTGPLLNGIAIELEALGYDTVLFTDNQGAAPDVWTALGCAAAQTTRVQLGTGVTNTLTRDVSVTADAALTLQALTMGRCVLAVGRGDASAHYMGAVPEPLASYEHKIAALRTYLRGDVVRRGDVDGRIEWLRFLPGLPPVPLELVPSGPRVARIAARFADRISFAVGADPEYVAGFVAHAKAEAEAAGRDPATIRFGAWINAVLHDDEAVARNAVRGTAALWARFSAFRGRDLASLPGPLAKAAQYLRDHYDMTAHGEGLAAHARDLPDDFIDWFTVIGSADRVRRRLAALAAAGLDYCYVVPGTLGFADEVGAASIQRVAREVLPSLAAGDNG